MENITIITDKDGNEFVIIDQGNEQFTSMTKAHYEAMQAEQSTPSVIDEA
jgi:hypothetical protein